MTSVTMRIPFTKESHDDDAMQVWEVRLIVLIICVRILGKGKIVVMANTSTRNLYMYETHCDDECDNAECLFVVAARCMMSTALHVANLL